MLQETKDPAIKLFGMKIPLPAGADDGDLSFTRPGDKQVEDEEEEEEESETEKVHYYTSYLIRTLNCVCESDSGGFVESVYIWKFEDDPFVKMLIALMGQS